MQPGLEELASDHESGASFLAGKAVHLAVGWLGSLPEPSGADFQEKLAAFCRELYLAQPSMAPFFNLANSMMLAGPGGPGAVLEAVLSFGGRMEKAADGLVRNASPLCCGKVLTISSSSAVRLSLLHAHAAGVLDRVVCLESRPRLEGTALARYLALEGIGVELFSDAAMGLAVQECDRVLVGADSVGDAGVMNKVGSLPLALLAREHRKPLHVLCDSSKLLPPAVALPVMENDAAELMEERGAVRVRNVYFEPVPSPLVTSFVMESGVLSPDGIGETRLRSEAHPGLLEWVLVAEKP